MPEPSVYSLNVHAEYTCRRSGACCTAGWSIPVEPRLRRPLGREWIVPLESGVCPEFRADARACRVHRDLGEDALPESCFQFPRRALIDERGTFVTLSHFCPTAAAMLVDTDAPLAIVDGPRAFPRERRYDGLDARQEWPPLVRPDVLFDPVTYGRWEAFLVAQLGAPDASLTATFERIATTAERLRQWTPERGTLHAWVEDALSRCPSGPLPDFYGFCNPAHAHELAVSTVPPPLEAPALPGRVAEADAELVAVAWDDNQRVVRRYVASKAFGSWSAYDGSGVRTQVAELLLSAAVLRAECVRACAGAARSLDRDLLIQAVRAADWLLIHLVDRPALMARLREVEAYAPAQLDA